MKIVTNGNMADWHGTERVVFGPDGLFACLRYRKDNA